MSFDEQNAVVVKAQLLRTTNTNDLGETRSHKKPYDDAVGRSTTNRTTTTAIIRGSMSR